MKKKLFLIAIFLLVSALFLTSCGDEVKVDDNKEDIQDKDNEQDKKDDDKPVEKDEPKDVIVISLYDEINFYLVDLEDESKREELVSNEVLINYLDKQREGKTIFYLVKDNDYNSKKELVNQDEVEGYMNYYFDIYLVSSRTSEMNDGDVITVNGKSGIVGLNAFNTMANVLIPVNALPKKSTPVLYLDSGEYNEVFHLYHDNITIYGVGANLNETERVDIEESIFTGSVSVRGNNIKINGMAVNDLEKTITVYGKDYMGEYIVLNK